jgi:hypothetical protein
MTAAGPPPPPADDALEHLWNAAHEFLKAVRGLVDAADHFVTEQRDRSPRDEPAPRVQHIDIEVDDIDVDAS